MESSWLLGHHGMAPARIPRHVLGEVLPLCLLVRELPHFPGAVEAVEVRATMPSKPKSRVVRSETFQLGLRSSAKELIQKRAGAQEHASI